MKLLLERINPEVAKITLNRPEKRNALSHELLSELTVLLEQLRNEARLRVVVITGAGSCFCAGMDLSDAHHSLGAMTEMIAKVLSHLIEMPQIVIARLSGDAIAGGGGIMAACDYVIASADCKIGFPEVRRGIVPAMVGTLLQRQVSERMLRDLLFSGRLIEASEALKHGLVNQVVEVDSLDCSIDLFISQVLLAGPKALAATKNLLARARGGVVNDIADVLVNHHRSEETMEGLNSFHDKRPPSWLLASEAEEDQG